MNTPAANLRDTDALGCEISPSSLDDVVTTFELARRPTRPPRHEAENRALVSLVATMADSPGTFLQKLVEVALELTGANSAGISVFEVDGAGNRVFRWRATAGAFSPFDGSTMPRAFSPCGVVLDRNATQLMADPVRYWPYIADLSPAIAEVLLVPFHDGETPVGTVWVVSHFPDNRFDAEDARLVGSVSRFASAAVRSLAHAEQLEVANRAKDRFLAVLSHELRTPLTPALLTATAMQEDESLPAAVREDASLIRRNIEVETRLIDDLLDVSRVASGKVELRADVVDLHTVLAECAHMCHAAAVAGDKDVAVELELRAARPAVSGDAARLRQVFSNLLSNAVKFTPAGGRVTVTTSDAGDQVRVAVSDTGVGIAADVLPHVFDVFEQGGRETTRRFGGLGLGLAIARGYVEAHGGRIAAESGGEGAGTTMIVLLPAVAHRPSAAPPPAPPVPEPRAGLNILLVEDHEDSLHAMTRLLRKLRHRVETATSVQGALAAAGQFDFDLLISDVGLPDGSGLDLMRRLRSTRQVPGIALTGYGSAADVAQTIDAGFAMHLTKPVRLADLKEAVRRVVVAAP